jgi:hypothetical protein
VPTTRFILQELEDQLEAIQREAKRIPPLVTEDGVRGQLVASTNKIRRHAGDAIDSVASLRRKIRSLGAEDQ